MNRNAFTVALIVSLFGSQLSMAMEKLSLSSLKFIENSKDQGMRFYFAEGTLRDEWIFQAVNAILDGSPVTVNNKHYLIEQLNVMVDILVGEPLLRNPNITRAQHQDLISKIKEKIQFIIDLKCLFRS